jgi:hypothetical protein
MAWIASTVWITIVPPSVALQAAARITILTQGGTGSASLEPQGFEAVHHARRDDVVPLGRVTRRHGPVEITLLFRLSTPSKTKPTSCQLHRSANTGVPMRSPKPSYHLRPRFGVLAT